MMSITYAQLNKFPPLNERHGIARVLGTLDDKVALNRETVDTLVARALSKSWFVEFDPVRSNAKATTMGHIRRGHLSAAKFLIRALETDRAPPFPAPLKQKTFIRIATGRQLSDLNGEQIWR